MYAQQQQDDFDLVEVPREKCGEIFRDMNGILWLTCIQCNLVNFNDIEEFADHITIHINVFNSADIQRDCKQSFVVDFIDSNDESRSPSPPEAAAAAERASPNEFFIEPKYEDEEYLMTEEAPSSPPPSPPPPPPIQKQIVPDQLSEEYFQCTNRFCDYCHTFAGKSKYQMEKHMQKVHGFSVWCDQCDLSFSGNISYYRHIASNKHLTHDDNKPSANFSCEHCNATFAAKRNLYGHMRRKHPVFAASSIARLAKPVKTTTNDEPPTIIRCKHCKVTFKAKRYLAQHIRRMHPLFAASSKQQNTKVLPIDPLTRSCCEYCNASFSVKRNLTQHIRRKHPLIAASLMPPPSTKQEKTTKLPIDFSCDVCNASFDLYRQLKYHKWNAHGIGAQCPICDRHFLEPVNMRKHIETHYDRNKYECKLCPPGRCFTSSYSLKAHMHWHNNERPYLCALCGQSFYTGSTLHSHKMRVHTEQREAVCTICLRTYKSKASLCAHMKKVHSQLRLECDICSGIFKSRSVLVQHMRLHSGNKSYKCRYCGDVFAQSAGRRFHERRNHEKTLIRDNNS